MANTYTRDFEIDGAKEFLEEIDEKIGESHVYSEGLRYNIPAHNHLTFVFSRSKFHLLPVEYENPVRIEINYSEQEGEIYVKPRNRKLELRPSYPTELDVDSQEELEDLLQPEKYDWR